MHARPSLMRTLLTPCSVIMHCAVECLKCSGLCLIVCWLSRRRMLVWCVGALRRHVNAK